MLFIMHCRKSGRVGKSDRDLWGECVPAVTRPGTQTDCSSDRNKRQQCQVSCPQHYCGSIRHPWRNCLQIHWKCKCMGAIPFTNAPGDGVGGLKLLISLPHNLISLNPINHISQAPFPCNFNFKDCLHKPPDPHNYIYQ